MDRWIDRWINEWIDGLMEKGGRMGGRENRLVFCVQVEHLNRSDDGVVMVCHIDKVLAKPTKDELWIGYRSNDP